MGGGRQRDVLVWARIVVDGVFVNIVPIALMSALSIAALGGFWLVG